MDLKFFLMMLSPKAYGDLTVDNTVGGVGFDPAKLSYNDMAAKIVRVTAEGGDFRTKECGVVTTASGDLLGDGDEFFVAGEEAIQNWRAIRVAGMNATLRYHVYF
jgi:hypothetical protein